ncbi:hypothetical protein Patl1_26912 [Pistacia atlantica]|uniref:Uncharacterized protein n=1 Tax=Pistacia atlantica TaxID=434234 RepID=A0ACC1B1L4_9ROSI|nr:hypothetical protein Patl1_26912 [Pistacia atlantica]
MKLALCLCIIWELFCNRKRETKGSGLGAQDEQLLLLVGGEVKLATRGTKLGGGDDGGATMDESNN